MAVAPIEADEIVAIKGGHIIGTVTLRTLPAGLRAAEIQIADGFHLAALDEDEYDPVMLFLNHSREPSAGFAGNIVLVAMRAISPGEELTTDYALFDRSCSAGTGRTSPPTCSAASSPAARPGC